MSDYRPPDDGSNWPENDLRREEDERRSWLEPYPPSDSPEHERASDEPPIEPLHEDEPRAEEPSARPDWTMPWDRPAEEAPPEPESDPWPVFEPPHAPETEPAHDVALQRDADEPPAETMEPAPWQLMEEQAREPYEPDWIEPEAAREPDSEPEPGPEPEPEPEPETEPEASAPWPSDPGAAASGWPPEEAEPPSDAEPEPPVEAPGWEQPRTEAGEPTTAFATVDGWDPRLDGERRRPTTAEQAVPWMIGVILALAGIVIVLLALIFTFPGGLAGSASPTPTASGEPSVAESAAAVASGQPSASTEPTPTAEPTPTPTPVPEYGPLEMVYLGRPSALAPTYLLRRDFSVDEDATVMAQAEQGVTAFAWSPDGRVGAAIIAGRAVAIEPGSSARALADDVSAISWGWDSNTLYAVRITRDGANDSTDVLQIDFASADVQTLATITYPHPVTAPDPKLKEAQFVDDGGLVRLYAVADGNLELWVLGAPATYRIDAGDGSVTEATGQPVLWAPDGRQRISLSEDGSTTTVSLLDAGEEEVASVQVTGLVSHIRWAPASNEIVFTLGHLSNAGGVRQDLYVWNLADGEAPMAMTSNGVSFGASWVGVSPNWMPPRS